MSDVPSVDPKPTFLEKVDASELTIFQMKIQNLGLQAAMIQKEISDLEKERHAFVATLKPKYGIEDGDRLEALADGSVRIVRKGDPNIQVAKAPPKIVSAEKIAEESKPAAEA